MYVASGPNPGHSVKMAVGIGAGERKTGGHRRPTRCLVLALDHPLNVETPDASAPGWKPKSAERNAEFHAPSVCVNLGSNVGYRIPALIPRVVVDLRVLLGSERVDRKHIGSPVIVKGIQGNAYGVVFPVHVIVPVAQGVSDNPVGIGIVAIDADIKRLRVVDEAHLGPLRGWSARVRFQLCKLSHDVCLLPGRVGQVTVDGRRSLDKCHRVTILIVLSRVILCSHDQRVRTHQQSDERRQENMDVSTGSTGRLLHNGFRRTLPGTTIVPSLNLKKSEAAINLCVSREAKFRSVPLPSAVILRSRT